MKPGSWADPQQTPKVRKHTVSGGWGLLTAYSFFLVTMTSKYQRSHLAKGEAWGNHTRPGDSWDQYLGVQYRGPVKIGGMNIKPTEDWITAPDCAD